VFALGLGVIVAVGEPLSVQKIFAFLLSNEMVIDDFVEKNMYAKVVIGWTREPDVAGVGLRINRG